LSSSIFAVLIVGFKLGFDKHFHTPLFEVTTIKRICGDGTGGCGSQSTLEIISFQNSSLGLSLCEVWLHSGGSSSVP